MHCAPFTKTQLNTNKCIQLVANNQQNQLFQPTNPPHSSTRLPAAQPSKPGDQHHCAIPPCCCFFYCRIPFHSSFCPHGASISIAYILDTVGKIRYFGKAHGNAIPIQAWTGPEAPRYHDSRYMKVVRSAPRTGRIDPPGNIPGTHSC